MSENRLNAAPYNRQDAAFANEGKENASGDIFADKTALATTKKPRRRRLNSDQSFDATIDAKTLQAELAQKQEEEIVMRAEIERIEREANERISKANAECVARLHELTSAHNEQLAKLSKVQSDFKGLQSLQALAHIDFHRLVRQLFQNCTCKTMETRKWSTSKKIASQHLKKSANLPTRKSNNTPKK